MAWELICLLGVTGVLAVVLGYLLIEARASARYYQQVQGEHDKQDILRKEAFKRELEIKNRPSGDDASIIDRL